MTELLPARIGVWNTAFLGDAVLTLPLLQTLRAAYPDAVIDFWVRKGFGSLFAAHPAISAVREYDKRGDEKGPFKAMRFGASLARERYALWISAHGSFRSGMIARRSSARMRIGYRESSCNAWFHTHTVPRKFAELEEVERLLQLLLPLNLASRNILPVTWPEILLPEEARASAEALFVSLPGERGAPVLGVHPGSIWGTKRWPGEYFAAVAARAAQEGARVLVFGGPGEEAMAGEVVARTTAELTIAEKIRVVNLAGRLSLPELAACIGGLSCYLTNDSGPMHLAWPQRTPVTALFGPTVRELGFFPRGEDAAVLELPLDCRPCGLHGPRECPLGHHRCMRDMVPDMVWPDVAAKLFNRS